MSEPSRPASRPGAKGRSGWQLPGGLRTRLAVTISLITAVAVGAAFVALERGTRSELEDRTDRELDEQYGEFRQEVSGSDLSSDARLERAAQRFIASQRYHPEARIFLIDIRGDRQVTNQPELVEMEIEKELGEDEEDREESELLRAREGLSTVSTEETGRLRALTRPIVYRGGRVGTFRVADPLSKVEDATEGLRDTFLIVGSVTVLLAIALAILVADRITGPLRRMASIARAVDAGDLSPRCAVETRDEVAQLAESFNHMLDRLQAAFERQRTFVSDASHELRTPLTVLRGQIEVLERTGDDPAERRRIIATLTRELGRTGRLVDEMLTLAKAEAGQLVAPRAIDLADFVADLERDLPLLGERDYRIEGRPEGTLVADPERLTQVLRNLVRNAVAHTEDGDPITVALRAFDGRVEFAVSDEGPGIPTDQLDLVFERFHRVTDSRARAEGGSGLGLAIARAIVEAHGGSIRAESRAGGGTTIRFELPGYRSRRR